MSTPDTVTPFPATHKMSKSVPTYVRLKPAAKDAQSPAQSISVQSETELELKLNPKSHQQPGNLQFKFTGILDQAATQLDCFQQTVASQWVDDVISNQSDSSCHQRTLLVYGCSNTGKTHTLQGSKTDPGLIQLALERLFSQCKSAPCLLPIGPYRFHQLQRMDTPSDAAPSAPPVMADAVSSPASTHQYAVWLSAVENYGDKLWDLLTDTQCPADTYIPTPCDIKHTSAGTFISGAKLHRIQSVQDAMPLLDRVWQRRHVHGTHLNTQSSRGHLYLSIMVVHIPAHIKTVEQALEWQSESDLPAFTRLNFVDVAGSERWKGVMGADPMRVKEAGAIHQSLSALHACLVALRQNQLTMTQYQDRLVKQQKEPSTRGGDGRPGTQTPSVVRAPPPKSTPFQSGRDTHRLPATVQPHPKRKQPGDPPTALHVPFRNSKLTQILEPDLTGRGRLAMIITVDPAMERAEETLHVLEFSAVARAVKTGMMGVGSGVCARVDSGLHSRWGGGARPVRRRLEFPSAETKADPLVPDVVQDSKMEEPVVPAVSEDVDATFVSAVSSHDHSMEALAVSQSPLADTKPLLPIQQHGLKRNFNREKHVRDEITTTHIRQMDQLQQYYETMMEEELEEAEAKLHRKIDILSASYECEIGELKQEIGSLKKRVKERDRQVRALKQEAAAQPPPDTTTEHRLQQLMKDSETYIQTLEHQASHDLKKARADFQTQLRQKDRDLLHVKNQLIRTQEEVRLYLEEMEGLLEGMEAGKAREGVLEARVRRLEGLLARYGVSEAEVEGMPQGKEEKKAETRSGSPSHRARVSFVVKQGHDHEEQGEDGEGALSRLTETPILSDSPPASRSLLSARPSQSAMDAMASSSFFSVGGASVRDGGDGDNDSEHSLGMETVENEVDEVVHASADQDIGMETLKNDEVPVFEITDTHIGMDTAENDQPAIDSEPEAGPDIEAEGGHDYDNGGDDDDDAERCLEYYEAMERQERKRRRGIQKEEEDDGEEEAIEDTMEAQETEEMEERRLSFVPDAVHESMPSAMELGQIRADIDEELSENEENKEGSCSGVHGADNVDEKDDGLEERDDTMNEDDKDEESTHDKTETTTGTTKETTIEQGETESPPTGQESSPCPPHEVSHSLPTRHSPTNNGKTSSSPSSTLSSSSSTRRRTRSRSQSQSRVDGRGGGGRSSLRRSVPVVMIPILTRPPPPPPHLVSLSPVQPQPQLSSSSSSSSLSSKRRGRSSVHRVSRGESADVTAAVVGVGGDKGADAVENEVAVENESAMENEMAAENESSAMELAHESTQMEPNITPQPIVDATMGTRIESAPTMESDTLDPDSLSTEEKEPPTETEPVPPHPVVMDSLTEDAIVSVASVEHASVLKEDDVGPSIHESPVLHSASTHVPPMEGSSSPVTTVNTTTMTNDAHTAPNTHITSTTTTMTTDAHTASIPLPNTTTNAPTTTSATKTKTIQPLSPLLNSTGLKRTYHLLHAPSLLPRRALLSSSSTASHGGTVKGGDKGLGGEKGLGGGGEKGMSSRTQSRSRGRRGREKKQDQLEEGQDDGMQEECNDENTPTVNTTMNMNMDMNPNNMNTTTTTDASAMNTDKMMTTTTTTATTTNTATRPRSTRRLRLKPTQFPQ